jgi:phospholipase C
MPILDKIDTIAIVMMENRSFDHMLGHLSLDAFDGRADVEGLQGAPDAKGRLEDPQYMNIWGGEIYYPFLFDEDRVLPGDAPHERGPVALQMGELNAGLYPMDGFAEAYAHKNPLQRTLDPRALGFFGPEHVPMTSFLASEYGVCDHWFSSIPTSTQPNRSMAFSGDSYIDETKLQIIPTNEREFLLNWLTEHDVRWRVYHDGLSFFVLFGLEWLDDERFRSFEELAPDVRGEAEDTFPQVLLIEPSYQSAPHLGEDQPNDNHAPLPIRNGEFFLKNVYDALTANPARWSRTLLILTYDEHGGFFDHVSPPLLRYGPPEHAKYEEAFEALGPRVPTILISPLVQRAWVCHDVLDNTSVLQLLGEKFGAGSYSDSVTERMGRGVLKSLSVVLEDREARAQIPAAPDLHLEPPCSVEQQREAGIKPGSDPIEFAFRTVAEKALDERPEATDQKYPYLRKWRETEKAREPYGQRATGEG